MDKERELQEWEAEEKTDLDGNGIDEIIVETTWIDYDRDAQGLANLDKEIGRHVDRHVYHWEGATFVEN
jgi:hypothetical protein